MHSPPLEHHNSLSANVQAERCTICLDEVSKPIETICEHRFCSECLLTWLAESDTCPLCRREIYIVAGESEDADAGANDGGAGAEEEQVGEGAEMDEELISLCIRDYREMKVNFDNLLEDDLREALWHLCTLDSEAPTHASHAPLEVSYGFLMPFVMAAILLAKRGSLSGTQGCGNLRQEDWECAADSMHDTLLQYQGNWVTGAQLRVPLLHEVVVCLSRSVANVAERPDHTDLSVVRGGIECAIDALLDQILHAFWREHRWFSP